MYMMPGSFPCESCGYVAGSHRMLARHRAACHESKVFRCSECPFVTRYRTNLYRHRREIHGLNKVNACAYCGFFATSPDDLRIHRETCPVGGGSDAQQSPLYQNELPSYEMFPNDFMQFGTVPNFKEPFPVMPQTHSSNDYSLFSQPLNFNNESFGYVSSSQPSLPPPAPPPPPPPPPPLPSLSKVPFDEIESTPDIFILPPSTTISQGSPKRIPRKSNKSRNGSPKPSKHLGPARVRRSYTCEPCDLKTTNPREYLAHRRDIHKEKIKIYGCKYCIYASKNPQKLQRHCGLVHRQLTAKKPVSVPIKKTQVAKKSSQSHSKVHNLIKEEKVMKEIIIAPKQVSTPFEASSPPEANKDCFIKIQPQKFKCSVCHFQTKSKLVLLHHEKTKHLKKKFYRCLQCVYVTHVKSRYTKHVRYHSLSKVKCELCDFKTAYKWNLDRHMKNHVTEGYYRCSKCCFSAHSKQSLTIHVVNHHSEMMTGTNDMLTEEDRLMLESLPSDVIKVPSLSPTPTLSSAKTEQPSARDSNLHDIPRTTGRHAVTRHNSNTSLNDTQQCDQYKRPSTPIEDEMQIPKLKSQKAIKSIPSPVPKKHESGSEQTEKKYSCPLCEVTFDHLAWLARHLNRRHSKNDQAKDISAIVQMLAAKSKSALSPKYKGRKNGITKKSHHGTPVCAVCGYKTKWFSEMKRHMRVHTDEKPFECPFCDYKCRWKGDLTRHVQKRHDEITEQNSEIHSKAFINSSETKSLSSLRKRKEFIHNEPETKVKRSRKLEEQDGPLDLSVGGNVPLPPRFHNDIPHFLQGSQYEEKYLQSENPPYETSRPLNYANSSRYNSSREVSPFHQVNTSQSKKVHKCLFCNFTTRNEFHFKVHNTRHFTKYPFMCSFCSFRSNWQWKVIKHIKHRSQLDDDHDDARVLLIDSKGDVCECYSDTGEDMYGGDDNVDAASDVSDSYLDAAYSDYSKQDRDEYKPSPSYKYNNTKPYICKYCGYKDREKRNVLAHMSDHTGRKPNHCRICGFQSLWLNVLKRHVRRRHKGRVSDIEEHYKIIEKAHVISVVGATVNRIVKPPENRPKMTTLCSCKVCPYKCTAPNVMANHVKHHNPINNASFKCRFCPYYCKYKDTIVKHMSVHGMTGPDAAKILPQCTVSQMNNEPAPNEKYQCTSCPYKTDSNSNFLYHKQCHRPNQNALFNCKQCSFWANHQTVFSEHVKLHSTEKQASDGNQNGLQTMPSMIEVKQNGKSFKVFKCRFCPMMGDSLETVYSHEAMHNSNVSKQKITCNICQEVCDSEESLTTHLKTHTDNRQANFSPLSEFPAETSLLYQKKKFYADSTTFLSDDNRHDSLPRKRYSSLRNKSQTYGQADSFEASESFSFGGHKYGYEMDKGYYNTSDFVESGDIFDPDENQTQSENNVTQCELNMSNDIQNGFDSSSFAWGQNSTEQGMENNGFDQMLLLEEAETKSYTKSNKQGNGVPQKYHNCQYCPAAFCKPAILAFHVSLHGSQGRYLCPECNYASDVKNNIITHYQLHAKTKPAPKNNVRNYECTKCPAAFHKPKGLRKHFALHGQKNKFTCEKCDYSVPCAVNLFRHKVVHANEMPRQEEAEPQIESEDILERVEQFPLQKEVIPAELSPSKCLKSEKGEDKRYFACSFCPYMHPRKFAVQNHMRRHATSEGSTCPHCNYTSLQASVIRDHLKWHFQPHYLFAAQAYMKYDDMEIWSIDEVDNKLIFKSNDIITDNELALTDDTICCLGKDGLSKQTSFQVSSIKSDNENNKDDVSPELENKLKALAMKQKVEVVLTDVFSQEKCTDEDMDTLTNLEYDDVSEHEVIQQWNSKRATLENNKVKLNNKDSTIHLHSDSSNSSDSTVVLDTALEPSEINDEHVPTTETNEVSNSKLSPHCQRPDEDVQDSTNEEISSQFVMKEMIDIVEANYLERNDAPTISEYPEVVVNDDDNIHTHLYGSDVMMVRFDDDYLPSESGITEVIEVEPTGDPDAVELSLQATMEKEEIICDEEMHAMFSDDVQVVEVVAENDDSINDFSVDLKTDQERNSDEIMTASCHSNNFITECEPTAITEVEIKV